MGETEKKRAQALGSLRHAAQQLEIDMVWLYANLDEENRELLVEVTAAAGLGPPSPLDPMERALIGPPRVKPTFRALTGPARLAASHKTGSSALGQYFPFLEMTVGEKVITALADEDGSVYFREEELHGEWTRLVIGKNAYWLVRAGDGIARCLELTQEELEEFAIGDGDESVAFT